MNDPEIWGEGTSEFMWLQTRIIVHGPCIPYHRGIVRHRDMDANFLSIATSTFIYTLISTFELRILPCVPSSYSSRLNAVFSYHERPIQRKCERHELNQSSSLPVQQFFEKNEGREFEKLDVLAVYCAGICRKRHSRLCK